ncbi:hypothetical protein TNCV_2888561 [Trichonephila clavipes]|nr:hypothetical protein TNCV_2888561 [Trichonephila clavipes]
MVMVTQSRSTCGFQYSTSLKTHRVEDWCSLNISTLKVLRLAWAGSSERGHQLRCRRQHLIVVQKDEVVANSPRVALWNDVSKKSLVTGRDEAFI